jgi:hypothetical protein
MPVTTPGRAIGSTRIAAEELEALDSERRQRAQHKGDRGSGAGGQDRVEERGADGRIRRRFAEPVEGQPGRRPREQPTLVEGVDGKDDQWQVQEGDDQR